MKRPNLITVAFTLAVGLMIGALVGCSQPVYKPTAPVIAPPPVSSVSPSALGTQQSVGNIDAWYQNGVKVMNAAGAEVQDWFLSGKPVIESTKVSAAKSVDAAKQNDADTAKHVAYEATLVKNHDIDAATIAAQNKRWDDFNARWYIRFAVWCDHAFWTLVWCLVGTVILLVALDWATDGATAKFFGFIGKPIGWASDVVDWAVRKAAECWGYILAHVGHAKAATPPAVKAG